MVLEQAESRVTDRPTGGSVTERAVWLVRPVKGKENTGAVSRHSLVVERTERLERTQLGQEVHIKMDLERTAV